MPSIPADLPSTLGAPAPISRRSPFVWETRIFFDQLDAMGMLHNAAYVVLLERTCTGFFESRGWRWETDADRNPDQYFVVREQSVRYLEPVVSPGPIAVEMWTERTGRTSVKLAFNVRSVDGAHLYAQATRVHVKLDPTTLRPRPWTIPMRTAFAALSQEPS